MTRPKSPGRRLRGTSKGPHGAHLSTLLGRSRMEAQKRASSGHGFVVTPDGAIRPPSEYDPLLGHILVMEAA